MLRTVKLIGYSGDQGGGMSEKYLLQFQLRCLDDLTAMFPEMAKKLLHHVLPPPSILWDN